MVSTAPMPGVTDLPVAYGADALRSMEQMQASMQNAEDQRLQFIASGMDRPVPPAMLGVPADGVTRFRSTFRKTWIDLRIPPDYGDTDRNIRAKNVFENNIKRDPQQGGLGPDWKKLTELDRKIAAKGKLRLEFKELPAHHESYYETSDPLEVQYLRQRMTEPNLSHIYEEAKPLMATLADGTQIEVMPITREGQMAAAAQGS